MQVNNLSPNPNAYYYYTSAPTSPKRHNLNDLYFLSMPTSPTRSITPDPAHDLSPFTDNFEFEGSKRFDHYDINGSSQKSQELAIIAYADELFYDGKMLPLRPPPSTQFRHPDKRLGNRSTASSPGGRTTVLRVPFMRHRNLWNDEFDPFMTALNKVKRDDNNPAHQLRRAKSLSPFRRPNIHHRRHERLGPQKDGPGPMGLDTYGPSKTNGGLESRKQRMKKFLLKNASFGKDVSVEEKEQRAPLLLRKMQNSGRFRLGAKSSSIARITKEMKALMKHRARVLFCLVKGIRFQGTRKLS